MPPNMVSVKQWIPYRDELCLYIPAGPALSWSEARVFCQDQKADLVVIKDYNKQGAVMSPVFLTLPLAALAQMFLTDLTDGARRHALHYWIGLAWQEARAQLTWVDGAPISQSWYRNWLQGHPKEERCVQLVGIYTGQWRDWDCSAQNSFVCEMPVKDALPGSVRKVFFHSRCYVFHFPSYRELRSWRQAQAFCQESGEGLAIVHDEEENAFLSDAFPEDGWHMWIGLRFGTTWRWSDSSSPAYFRWHLAPLKVWDQCVALHLQPTDLAQHGTWKTRPCNLRPTAEITGFICQHRYGFCGPPEPVHFPLPGGLDSHATADVTFSFAGHSTCSLALMGLHANITSFQIRFESNATHVCGGVVTELSGFPVHKNFSHMPFSPGLNTWSLITYPDGIASFFNHQEHFRLSNITQDISFANLSFLRITGVPVVNASLQYRLSFDLHFPSGSSLQVEDAIHRYLSNFTIGLWVRSHPTDSPKMCVVSYSLKWRRPEFALFLLSPSGLEFHIKGAVMFRGQSEFLLDGFWHHVAVSVSSTLGVPPFEVFVDGELWEPHLAEGSNSFLQKGLSLGGKLSVGQLEVDNRGTSFYVGDLSEVNLWDQALPEISVKQLAASRTQWKYPGNVVSWSKLVAKKPPAVHISTPREDHPDTTFVWFGLLQLRGKRSVLCADPEWSLIYTELAADQCPKHALWGLQPNGQLRNVADPPSCLKVAPDGVSLLSSPDCSTDAKSSFRLLPDQRLQNLHSGFCLFQEVVSSKLSLEKCTPQALYFVLDRDVHCPRSQGWRSRKDKCLFLVLNAALKWSQALKFCQRFHDGSLVTLSSLQDLVWLQKELRVSVWTGLHSSGGTGLLSWADGAPFNKALRRFVFFRGTGSGMAICMLALTSGFLKAEPCHRPHRWICQASRQSDSYMTFPGKSFYGAPAVDLSFSSLEVAKRQCTALGTGCDVVLSTVAGYHLVVGTRFVTLEDPNANPAAVVYVKTGCSPGYSGQDCQSMCPRCEPGMNCNPLTGLCDGFLYYKEAHAVYASLKCLPFGDWVFEHGACVSSERYSIRDEAESICVRYLGATVQKVKRPLDKVWAGISGIERRGPEPGSFLWACQRPEDMELLSFREKLLVSLQGSTPQQKRASLEEAKDACFLQKERCTGLLSLNGAHYLVAGTVLVDSPGSGAVLYIKAACSPGFCGDGCQRHCSPCLSTRIYNPLTGQCDGLLHCVRRFSSSCLHGLVSSRCPRSPGWWFWEGHCYYVEERSSKSWQGAKAACQAHGEGVSLLTLSSAKEKVWIAAMVQKDSWTGLNDVDKDGVWAWGEAGEAADLSSPWLADVPLVRGACLEIGRQGEGRLAASPCSELKPWVCEGMWAAWSSCPMEPGWSHWNGSCYFWDSSLVHGWDEALRACRRFRKTELLYLTSLQERDWIRSNFRGSFWTGLNDLQEESVFRWTAQEPLSQQMAPYLKDDLADGGMKDCVWFDTATGLLGDASCKDKRPFLCKCSEATEWFDTLPGHGVAGEPSMLYPSAKSLEQAKQECLMERSVCVAILHAGEGFYLISSMDGVISKLDSTLYMWTICAEGFSGPHCRRALASPPRPACDCSGRFQTMAEKVCGLPVQTCVDDCQRMTAWNNCSVCLPTCTGNQIASQIPPLAPRVLFLPTHPEASLSQLDPDELALITMVQFKVSHSLNLTAEDERDRGNSSRIIYDAKYP
ncbi:uncharacterized protein LOC133373965 [Rhineura floridana]|uniref:uncharacterized protein LOC133373965 n=1 Tax=Rhineura floridana TaxID=261503 RepID=UPI002AC82743|nr:uncharacterized protein LOC133373965 [Rhineura floridana]